MCFLFYLLCNEFKYYYNRSKLFLSQRQRMNQKQKSKQMILYNNQYKSTQYQPDQLIKAKIADFILSYQKSTLDKQFKKQKIKQTIMIDLLSMKNNQNVKTKNQPSSSSTAQRQSSVKDFQMSMEISNLSKTSKRGSKNSISEENSGKIKKNSNDLQVLNKQQNLNIEESQTKNSKLIPDFFHPNKSRASFKNSSVRDFPQIPMTQQDDYNRQVPSFGFGQQQASKYSLTDRIGKNQNSTVQFKKQKYSVPPSPKEQQLRLPSNQEIIFNNKISNNLSSISNKKKFTDAVFKNNSRNLQSKQQEQKNQMTQNKSKKSLISDGNIEIQDYEEDQVEQSMGSTTFGKKNQSLINMNNYNQGQNQNKSFNHNKQKQNSSQLLENNFIKKPNVSKYIDNVEQLRKSELQNNKSQDEEQLQLQQEQKNHQNASLGQEEQFQSYNQAHQKYEYQDHLNQEKDQYEEEEEDNQNQNENDQHLNNEENQQQQNYHDLDEIQENKSMQVSKLPIKQLDKSVTKKIQEQETVKNNPNSKSYAFQIVMDKSTLEEKDIEQLRKKKIMEMEKKRLERLEAHSKNKNSMIQDKEANTKTIIGASYARNSKINNHSKDNRDSLNKSGQQKPQRHLNNLKKQESQPNYSHFDDRQTVASRYYENQKDTPIQSRNNNNKPLSPYGKTPKTIQSTKTNIPLNKQNRDNIFIQQPSNTFMKDINKKQRNSSSQKYIPTEPKIQPKTVKSTFTKHSNRKLMINAITYTCLPGQLNRRQRQRLIDVIESYEQSQYFIFLFKEYSRKVVKGIFVMDMDQIKISKIYGDKAPAQITSQMVHEFYRFDSGSRQFKKIDGCKSFSFSIHAIDLK